MRTDYKFWYIRRNDDGFITEAAVRFYEGDVTTELEKDRLGRDVSVIRYRRSKKLQGAELSHLKSKKIVKDSLNQDAALYDSGDFGAIKTDEELRIFLNGELKKDIQRSPIDEQT